VAGTEPAGEQISFLNAIADQAAVAVENARLLSEAQGKAALEERQRLARELHDSVSQAIFSIALHARTARTLLTRDPGRVSEPLEHIFSLSQAAMAEMRALIFELRPESLETEGLIAAITKQTAALRARHGIDVHLKLCEEPDLPIDTKEVLYRIAQEAIHNTIKHAHATRVDVVMDCSSTLIKMQIKDNGVGFDATGQFPGHLGLQSMRERIARVGGTLDIDSRTGSGTSVRVVVPMPGLSGITNS
jgi:signal transduction histidine kinase